MIPAAARAAIEAALADHVTNPAEAAHDVVSALTDAGWAITPEPAPDEPQNPA